MQLRTLGRTGVKVSPLCLGAMMFGAWGNPDHDESIRDHPPRARRRDQLHRHRRRLLARRVRGDRRQGAGRRPARRRRARHQGPRHDGRRPQPVRQLAPLDRRARSRTACAGCGTDWIDLYQIHRPEPDTDIDETLGALTDLVRAGQGPLHRQLDLPGRRRSSRPSGSPSGAGASASSASSRRTRSSCAASRPTCCRPAERYGMGVIPWSPLAGGWLTGRYRKGQDLPETHRAQRMPAALRPVAARQPGQARGRRRARAAGRGGRAVADRTWRWPSCSRHPAVTAAIIGPRTMEQLERQLGAADVDARPTTCSTASTRSCRRGRTSTLRMRGGRTRRCRGRARRTVGLEPAARRCAARPRPWARRSARVTGSVRARTTIGTARATISHMTVGSPYGVGDDAQAGGRDPADPDGQAEAHPGGEAQAAGQVLLAHDDGDREGQDDEEARRGR